MFVRNFLIAGLLVCLAGCSSVTEEEPVVYSYPKHQLSADTRYGTTAWVQPPTVVLHGSDQSGFSEGEAPLLKPADAPVKAAAPKLPPATSQSRKY